MEQFEDAYQLYRQIKTTEGGTLYDVTCVVKILDFPWRLTLTKTAWETCIAPQPRFRRVRAVQNIVGVVHELQWAIRSAPSPETLDWISIGFKDRWGVTNRVGLFLTRQPDDGGMPRYVLDAPPDERLADRSPFAHSSSHEDERDRPTLQRPNLTAAPSRPSDIDHRARWSADTPVQPVPTDLCVAPTTTLSLLQAGAGGKTGESRGPSTAMRSASILPFPSTAVRGQASRDECDAGPEPSRPRMETGPMKVDEIYTFPYSREQAIKDGVLIDVTSVARALGFPWPLAMTLAALRLCIKRNPGIGGPNESDNLIDAIQTLQNGIPETPPLDPVARLFLATKTDYGRAEFVSLVVDLHPDASGSPRYTLYAPWEE